ncbi:hypothetical protein N657DRAFT_594145 [Parathielavia appendiculata]|uniref:F-box domain-containing protein n=1 Tax=Parathielavia appendiculata TaxID=2587402 RepID=A0AAN6U2E0_9PEZI|nr:hypothetical protein N657DRAFT_594145 [Parathielavia appendiculata]
MSELEGFRLVSRRLSPIGGENLWGHLSLIGGETLWRPLQRGAADKLVNLLAVPVRPPNSATLDRPSSTKAHKCFPADEHATLSTDYEPAEVPGGRYAENSTSGNHSLTIFHLSPELHRVIFDHIDLIDDVVCFGLTSRHFWSIARLYLHAHNESFLGQWAGSSIVCAGPNTQPDDFPPGMFSAEELDRLRQKWASAHRNNDDSGNGSTDEPFNLFTVSALFKRRTLCDVMHESSLVFERCMDRGGGSHYDPAFWATLPELIVKESTYFPQDEPWVLRNLTTREFVRSRDLGVTQNPFGGPEMLDCSFGTIVLSRIWWSSDDEHVSFPNCPRGAWAGHRLDITTLTKHQDTTNAAEWSDISKEVEREYVAVWKSKYGARADDRRRQRLLEYAKGSRSPILERPKARHTSFYSQ